MVSMDETNTANSSSAAAVADGASAAAHTKTVGASPIKSASHVKLLIKSSNQQYEDHVIESDLLWTVERLKYHLSSVYPNKPLVADQKLIYSGQLLKDNLQLKDVIRSYKDVYTQNHIIHLVYTPKNLPALSPQAINKGKVTSGLPTSSTTNLGGGGGGGRAVTSATNMSSTDGLRQRHNAGNNGTDQQSMSATVQQPQQQQPLFHQQMHPYLMAPQMNSMAGMTCPQYSPQNSANAFGGTYNVQAMISQQAAMYNWMQQVYSQYIEQCLRLSNIVSDSSGNANRNIPAQFPAIPPNFQQLFQQQFAPTVMIPLVPETNATVAANTNAAVDAAASERQDQQQEQQQQQQQQPAQAQVAAQRFPNLHQDEQDNRDWLDDFFSITRFALFLALLYVNSSPLRCLVVVIIAGGLYLHHIGVFRLRFERNNNNLNRNNNAAQNAAVDQIRQGVDQQQNVPAAPAPVPEEQQNNNENNAEGAHQEAQQQPDTTDTTHTDTPENTNTNNESIMSTIRTFVVTFFTSLLPETPAL